MASNESQSPVNEPRKKRAKIVSACGECRRRKTKCNGELPCSSCHKADVPCAYPIISHAEDKRNNISKAALEAIEDRLKRIENMLQAILQSQPIEPLCESLSPPTQQSSSFVRPSQVAQQSSQKIITTPDVRLPSIHDLSSRPVYSPSSSSPVEIKQELSSMESTAPPLLRYPTYYPSSNCRIEMVSPKPTTNEYRLAPTNDNKNKRKRS